MYEVQVHNTNNLLIQIDIMLAKISNFGKSKNKQKCEIRTTGVNF